MGDTPLNSGLSQAVSLRALKQVSTANVEEVVAALREQGIGSLEDLVGKAIESASQTVTDASALADLEPWEFMCYRWFWFRNPPWSKIRDRVINEIDQLDQSLGDVDVRLDFRREGFR